MYLYIYVYIYIYILRYASHSTLFSATRLLSVKLKPLRWFK